MRFKKPILETAKKIVKFPLRCKLKQFVMSNRVFCKCYPLYDPYD